LPNIVAVSGSKSFYGCNALQIVNMPQVIRFSDYDTFRGMTSLVNVVFGSLIEISRNTIDSGQPKLRNITIGQGTNVDLPFHNWTATNVVNEGQSDIDELNNNLRTNLLEKLADHSTDGQTRTLRLGWLAHVTQENIDYANSKGWTLTT
jgi:hypothetical protein